MRQGDFADLVVVRHKPVNGMRIVEAHFSAWIHLAADDFRNSLSSLKAGKPGKQDRLTILIDLCDHPGPSRNHDEDDRLSRTLRCFYQINLVIRQGNVEDASISL